MRMVLRSQNPHFYRPLCVIGSWCGSICGGRVPSHIRAKVSVWLIRMRDILLSHRYPRYLRRYCPTLRTDMCCIFVLSFARPLELLCIPQLKLPPRPTSGPFVGTTSRLLAIANQQSLIITDDGVLFPQVQL